MSGSEIGTAATVDGEPFSAARLERLGRLAKQRGVKLRIAIVPVLTDWAAYPRLGATAATGC